MELAQPHPANGVGSLCPVRRSSWGRSRPRPIFVRTPFVNEAVSSSRTKLLVAEQCH